MITSDNFEGLIVIAFANSYSKIVMSDKKFLLL